MNINEKLQSFATEGGSDRMHIIDAGILSEPEMMDITITIRVSKEAYLETVDKQFGKGISKYGQTLDNCSNHAYEWNTMILEEIVDALAYNEKLYQYEEEVAENI